MVDEAATPVNEFHHAPSAAKGLEDSYVKSSLTKWDILRGSQFCRFRYTAGFHKMAPEQFLRDLFSSPAVGAVLQRINDKNSKEALTGAVVDVEWEHVRTGVTSMAFFDRLETCDPPVVRAGGRLVQCMDDVYDGVTVSDELRKMLVSEESDNAELFSAQDKSEFLFRIFRSLAIGGAMSQFEDTLSPYTDVSKRVYKALVGVKKNATTQSVEVTSSVYLVKGVTAHEGVPVLWQVPGHRAALPGETKEEPAKLIEWLVALPDKEAARPEEFLLRVRGSSAVCRNGLVPRQPARLVTAIPHIRIDSSLLPKP